MTDDTTKHAEHKDNVIEKKVEDAVPPQNECISSEDSNTLQQAQYMEKLALAQAERAIAISKQAQAESKNIVLSLYLKHELKPGIDEISPAGVIIRKSRESNG